MKIFLSVTVFLFFMAVAPIFAQLDVKKPSIKGLPAAEIAVWAKKDIAAWKAAFGGAADGWNPLQMEFYSAIKIAGLSPEDKKKYMNFSDADWEKQFNGTMDVWKVEDMLFFSAIQELKNQ